MVGGAITISVLVGTLFCIPRFSSPDVHTIGCGMGFLLLVGMISAVPFFGVGCEYATSGLFGSGFVLAGPCFVVFAILVFDDQVGMLLEGVPLKKSQAGFPLRPRSY